MKITDITCDLCGKNLATHDGSDERFRLSLNCEMIRSTNPIRYDMLYYPPLNHEAHFCNFGHLLQWLEQDHPTEAEGA